MCFGYGTCRLATLLPPPQSCHSWFVRRRQQQIWCHPPLSFLGCGSGGEKKERKSNTEKKKREKEGGKEVCLALSRKTIIAGKKNFPCFPLSPNWLGRGNKAEGRERGRERSKDKSWFWGIRTLREKEREREREKRQCIMVLQNVES